MNNRKISVVVTVFNEEKSIKKLLDSLVEQTLKPSEVLIVDAGSTDKTLKLIRQHKLNTKLIIKKGISRSKARNLGVKLSKNDIIAMTDAGCIAKNNWLENITKPMIEKQSEVVAGFYDMFGITNIQKGMAIYMGVLPKYFSSNFLPSTRSIAFTKNIWKRVGYFPINLNDTAEDTVFNHNLISKGVKIVRIKNARVEWGMPKNIVEFGKKLYRYAKGDAQSKIIWNPIKGFSSHNIRAFFVLVRSTVFISLLIVALFFPILIPYLVLVMCSYIIFSIFKVYKKIGKWRVAKFGPILQLTADISVSLGFLRGILYR